MSLRTWPFANSGPSNLYPVMPLLIPPMQQSKLFPPCRQCSIDGALEYEGRTHVVRIGSGSSCAHSRTPLAKDGMTREQWKFQDRIYERLSSKPLVSHVPNPKPGAFFSLPRQQTNDVDSAPAVSKSNRRSQPREAHSLFFLYYVDCCPRSPMAGSRAREEQGRGCGRIMRRPIEEGIIH